MSGIGGYEQVQCSIWDDEPFALLSPEAKLLYVWTFTNQAVSSSGIFKARREQMLLHTKLTPARLDAALAALSEHRMAFYYDGYIWCRARARNIKTGRSPNRAKSIARDIAAMSRAHPLRVAFVAEYGTDPWLCRLDEWQNVVLETPEEGIAMGSENAYEIGESGTPPEPFSKGPLLLVVSSSSSSSSSLKKNQQLGASEHGSTDEPKPEDVVWAHYLAERGDRKGKLPEFDGTRRRVVKRALNLRPLDVVLAAVTGLFRSDWHVGKNPDGKRWDSIRYALKGNQEKGESDEERIDSMAALAAGPATGLEHTGDVDRFDDVPDRGAV